MKKYSANLRISLVKKRKKKNPAKERIPFPSFHRKIPPRIVVFFVVHQVNKPFRGCGGGGGGGVPLRHEIPGCDKSTEPKLATHES